jgi:lysophospholipase L1-like esterase
MLALSGMADRGGGPRRSPVEIIATMGSYVTRTQAAEVSGLRAGPFGRWADGVTAMREDCAVFARHWQAHNDRVLADDGPLWVVLGDSTAQGLGAPGPDRGYVGQVLTGLRQRTGLPWRVLNLSVSGALTRDVLGAQLPLLPAQADLVTCGIGVNDILYTSPSKLFADLRALIAAVPDQTVLLDLPLPAGCWGFLGRASVPYVTRINRTIHQCAAARGLPVAEVSAHFTPPWPGKFASDCFHPSQAGHRDWASALLAAVPSPPVPGPGRKRLERPLAGTLHSRHDRHGAPASHRAALTPTPPASSARPPLMHEGLFHFPPPDGRTHGRGQAAVPV